EKAQALDRFFVNMPPPAAPDPRLLGDFFVPGEATLGALAEIYGLQIASKDTDVTLADYIAGEISHAPRQGDIVGIGPIALLVHKVDGGKVMTVGLRLAEPELDTTFSGRLKALWARVQKFLG
ncbi:MAG TPA: transporter associated domain-containing protein, partial [Pseudolabrys sp.]|nr:transporter associated domain-containing protein [Pseudolabrys sp.]